MSTHPTTGLRLNSSADHPAMNPAKAAEPPAVATAIDYLRDRQDRLDTALDQFADQLERLAMRLAPVLREGRPVTYPQPGGELATPAPEDVRGEVARAISGTGRRADQQGDTVNDLGRRVDAIVEALEV